MLSSGHFDPNQIFDGYKAVEVLDPAWTECLAKGKYFFEHYNPRSSKCHYCFIGKKPYRRTGKEASNIRRYLWSKKDGTFEKEFPASEAPTLDGTSGYSALTCSRKGDVARWTNVGGPIPVGGRPIYSSSEVPISGINTGGIVKRIRQISDSPPDPDSEGSDESNGEEVEVIPHSAGQPSNSSPSSLLPGDFKVKSYPVPPELSNPPLPPFLLQFLLLHHTLPTPDIP
ncbi:hypothetical protein O181_130538 [Austropuccinia psidii MF-1]|uniref:Uncharacterized protein n=1 Tax=Austropuccinia psidii MF-1 TaxID=1389203 RepID=A0A9Q3Q9W5_9BASI|nr:hypothetical protein [Austropuccinia psidii MF-1]